MPTHEDGHYMKVGGGAPETKLLALCAEFSLVLLLFSNLASTSACKYHSYPTFSELGTGQRIDLVQISGTSKLFNRG